MSADQDKTVSNRRYTLGLTNSIAALTVCCISLMVADVAVGDGPNRTRKVNNWRDALKAGNNNQATHPRVVLQPENMEKYNRALEKRARYVIAHLTEALKNHDAIMGPDQDLSLLLSLPKILEVVSVAVGGNRDTDLGTRLSLLTPTQLTEEQQKNLVMALQILSSTPRLRDDTYPFPYQAMVTKDLGDAVDSLYSMLSAAHPADRPSAEGTYQSLSMADTNTDELPQCKRQIKNLVELNNTSIARLEQFAKVVADTNASDQARQAAYLLTATIIAANDLRLQLGLSFFTAKFNSNVFNNTNRKLISAVRETVGANQTDNMQMYQLPLLFRAANPRFSDRQLEVGTELLQQLVEYVEQEKRLLAVAATLTEYQRSLDRNRASSREVTQVQQAIAMLSGNSGNSFAFGNDPSAYRALLDNSALVSKLFSMSTVSRSQGREMWPLIVAAIQAPKDDGPSLVRTLVNQSKSNSPPLNSGSTDDSQQEDPEERAIQGLVNTFRDKYYRLPGVVSKRIADNFNLYMSLYADAIDQQDPRKREVLLYVLMVKMLYDLENRNKKDFLAASGGLTRYSSFERDLIAKLKAIKDIDEQNREIDILLRAYARSLTDEQRNEFQKYIRSLITSEDDRRFRDLIAARIMDAFLNPTPARGF